MRLSLTISKRGIMITYVGVFPATNNHKLGGLKRVYSLTVGEVRSPKSVSLGQNQSVCRHCRSASEARGRTPHCLFSFRWPLAFLDLWLHHYSLCLLGYTFCFPLQRMPVIVFRIHLIIQDNSSNSRSLNSPAELFPHEVKFIGVRA